MKTLIYFISLLFISNLSLAQSIVIGSGSSLEVRAGSDMCAGVPGNISGNFFGDGTECSEQLSTTFQLSVSITDG